MSVEAIETDKAPAAIGPYSQAIVVDGFVFCSGQIALNPETGEMANGDVQTEIRQVMENLKAVLEAADSSLERVVRTTIYLADMSLFPEVNEVYGSFFGGTPPARATVGVAALPANFLVEIEAWAYVPQG